MGNENLMLDIIADQSNKLRLVHTALIDLLAQIEHLRQASGPFFGDEGNQIWELDTLRATNALVFKNEKGEYDA